MALDLQITNDHSVPLYQRIKDSIREKIRSDSWPPGAMVPSENQLSSALDASRMTVNRALRELSDEGLLRRVHGLGTFVADPPRHAHLIELRSIADEIREQGKVHRAEILKFGQATLDSELCQRFEFDQHRPPVTFLFEALLVHFQDDTPIQIEHRYVNPQLVPDFGTADFTTTTPAEFLMSAIRAEQLEHIVQAILPSPEIALQLRIPNTEPCLKLRRRTWKNGQVVTSADLIYPSSRYDLGAKFKPKSF